MSRSVVHAEPGQGETLPTSSLSVAIALGGGGARGLAHIAMLEALDELGIKPRAIAGTSIGALIGAAYASGLSGREIRAHCEAVLSERIGLVRELIGARASSVWSIVAMRSAVLDPQALLEVLLPRRMATDFNGLSVPLAVVATDFYAQEPRVLTHGDLKKAVAASMALPVIFQPVMHEGRALLDGGLVNPLPFDILAGAADVIVAIDVAGAPHASPTRDHPSATEALWASSFIFERSIIREKLKSCQPDIYVEAGTAHFQILDFLKFRDILEAALPAKERLKAQLRRVLGATPAEALAVDSGTAGQLTGPRDPPRE